MPEPRKRSTGPRTRTAATAAPAFAADDEQQPMTSDLPVGGGKGAKFSPLDRSVPAVQWRQAEYERQTGMAYDPVTMQRVVVRPSGRGTNSLQLRSVEMDNDFALRQQKAAAEGKDYWHPDAGWIRGGVKRETDIEATREDNVFDEGV